MNRAVLTGETNAAPRSIGTLHLSTKQTPRGSGLDNFRTSGATKVAFPRRHDAVEAIMLNTSGGLTGGDRFDTKATAGAGSKLVLTTQAAERGYESLTGTARVSTHLKADANAVLHWVPQELILFNKAAIDRRLTIDVHETAELLVVEPLIFGRGAMGETLTAGNFRDRITIRQNNAPLYWDSIHLAGDIHAQLARPAVTNGMAALASVTFISPRAEALLPKVRHALPDTGGASLLAPDLLCLRLVAADSYLLRRTLIPVLEILSNADLPKSWSL